jgi:hypothetical protein
MTKQDTPMQVLSTMVSHRRSSQQSRQEVAQRRVWMTMNAIVNAIMRKMPTHAAGSASNEIDYVTTRQSFVLVACCVGERELNPHLGVVLNVAFPLGTVPRAEIGGHVVAGVVGPRLPPEKGPRIARHARLPVIKQHPPTH